MNDLAGILQEFCEPAEKWMRTPFLFRYGRKRYLMAISDARIVAVEDYSDTKAPIRRLRLEQKQKIRKCLDLSYPSRDVLSAHEFARQLKKKGKSKTRFNTDRDRYVRVLEVKAFNTIIDGNLLLPVIKYFDDEPIRISYDERHYMPIRLDCGSWTIILAPVAATVDQLKDDSAALAAALAGKEGEA